MATGENILWVVEIITCWRTSSYAKHVRYVFRTRAAANAYAAKVKNKRYGGWHRSVHVARATWGPEQ